MSKKIVVASALIIAIVISVTCIYLGILSSEETLSPKEKQWEVVLDLELPENSNENGQNFRVGTAQVTLPENSTQSAEDLFHEIFDQYIGFQENSLQINGKVTHALWVRAIGENWLLEHDIPPIRQDNVGENFCFYAWHGAQPVMIVGGGTDTWWDTLECDGLALTLLLPSGYELRTNVTTPFGYGGYEVSNSYSDNESNIFTTASELSKRFENNRWRIEASWTMGEFDKLNTPLYLEIHYWKVS